MSAVTRSFPQWRGGIGARWHMRLAGYAGHIVQVVNDFGELVAVAGRCRSALAGGRARTIEAEEKAGPLTTPAGTGRNEREEALAGRAESRFSDSLVDLVKARS